MDKILSIVVPAYNLERYISHCLKNFIDLNIMHLVEVIVINDGSTDRTEEIAKYYQVKYPALFQVITKENGGHGSAINCGIRIASGKYFMVVDGDDWVSTNEYATLVQRLRINDLDLAVFQYRRVHAETKASSIVKLPKVKFEKGYTFQQLQYKKHYFVLSSICYRTSLLKENGIALLEDCYYVDLQYVTQPMCYVNTIKFFNLVVYNYRIGNTNQSVHFPNMVLRYAEHEKVVKTIIHSYHVQSLSKYQAKYIQSILIKALYTQYHLALTYDSSSQRGAMRAKKFDIYLKHKDYNLYKQIGKRIFLLPYLRKHGFNVKQYRNSFLLNLKKIILTFVKGKSNI